MQTPDPRQTILSEKTYLRLPSRPEIIGPIVEFLRQKAVACGACHESRSGKLLIALQEALSNAIIHGNLQMTSDLRERDDDAFIQLLNSRAADPAYNLRRVDLVIDYDSQRCQWTITDEGDGFDVEGILAQQGKEEADLERPSGRGILLMRSLMDDVQYEEGGRCVTLTMYKESGHERRTEERRSVYAQVHVAPLAADGSTDWSGQFTAVSRNLSHEGISLLLHKRLVGQRLLVGLRVEGQTVYVPAQVRHQRSLSEETIELGCSFLEQVPALSAAQEPPVAVMQAVGKLIDRSRRPSLQRQERRIHQRVPYSDRLQIQTEPGAPLVMGYPRDLSRGGIAFVTTTTLPREVTLIFPAQGEEPALRVRCAIMRFHKIDDSFYDVGARFLDFDEPNA